jgi:hypothetical protein
LPADHHLDDYEHDSDQLDSCSEHDNHGLDEHDNNLDLDDQHDDDHNLDTRGDHAHVFNADTGLDDKYDRVMRGLRRRRSLHPGHLRGRPLPPRARRRPRRRSLPLAPQRRVTRLRRRDLDRTRAPAQPGPPTCEAGG